MRYLVSVIDDKSNPGSTDRQPAISAFNERLIAEGYWVFAGGLADTDAATVIDNRGEQAREDTFYCQKCGAIPRDSEAYREIMEAPDAYDPRPDRL